MRQRGTHHVGDEYLSLRVLHQLTDRGVFRHRERQDGRSFHRDRFAEPDISGIFPDLNDEFAAFHEEVLHLWLIVGKGTLIQRKRYRSGLTGGQCDLAKIPEFPDWAADGAFGIPHIELHRSLSEAGSRVAHIDVYGEGVPVSQSLFVCPQIGIRKIGIAQTVAEGEGYGHFLFIIIPVPDKDALRIGYDALFPREVQIGGRVLQPQRPGFRQMAAGILLAVQQLHGCCAHLLAAQMHQQHGIHFLEPGQRHNAAAVKDDDRVRIDGGHSRDEFVLILRKADVLPIRALGFVGVRKAGKHDGRLSRRRQCYSFLQKRPVAAFLPAVISPGVGNVPVRRRLYRADRVHYVDMAGAGALIAGRSGKFSDKRNFLIFLQRQRTVIFQQDSALGADFSGQRSACRPVDHGSLFFTVHGLGHKCQNVAYRPIQRFLRQFPSLHRLNQLLAVGVRAAGHFQIKPRCDALRAPLYGAPVRNDKTLIAPLCPENIGE